MRSIAIALALLLSSGCTDPEPAAAVECAAGESSSTGADVDETDEADADDDSSSSGDIVEEWPGNVLADVRIITTDGEPCRDACGASTCLGGRDPASPGELLSCLDWSVAGSTECMCADFTEEATERTTHAFSSCWLNPNSGSTQAVDPPKWDQGTCDDFCGRFGYTCAGTIWSPSKGCPNVLEEWPSFYADGDVTRPADVDGPDGVFVAVCEL